MSDHGSPLDRPRAPCGLSIRAEVSGAQKRARLSITKRGATQQAMRRQRLDSDAVMYGSAGVDLLNPSIPGDGWGPWEPWLSGIGQGDSFAPALRAIWETTRATRADLEQADELELLLLVAALWESLGIDMGPRWPVVHPVIEALAAETVQAPDALPAWLPAPDAVDHLRRPLVAALLDLRGVLDLEDGDPTTARALVDRGWSEEDGALWLSSRMDAALRRRWGPDAGLQMDRHRGPWAAHQRGELSAAEVMRPWLDPEHEGPIPSPLVTWIARLVWGEERERLERERRPVVMPVGVLAMVTAPLRATGGLQIGTDGREWLTRARLSAPAELLAVWQPPTVAVQDAGHLRALARAGVPGLVTVNGPRLVYWYAREVQLQIRRGGDAAPLVFDGGDGGNAWATLARAVGAPDDREGARAMRGIVAALAATVLILDTNKGRQEGNLLTYHYQEGRGRGRVSRLELTPGWPFKLNPAELRGEAAELSALAPLPPLPGNLPPMPEPLRRNDHAAAGRLWMAVLAELARSNQEIARGNGAHLPGSRLAGLAVEVGVIRPEPLVLGAGLLAQWTRDGEHGPALLERVGEDRYHLGPGFPEERRLLEEGGRHRDGQAERGKIATRKRAAKAEKGARHRDKRKGDT